MTTTLNGLPACRALTIAAEITPARMTKKLQTDTRCWACRAKNLERCFIALFGIKRPVPGGTVAPAAGATTPGEGDCRFAFKIDLPELTATSRALNDWVSQSEGTRTAKYRPAGGT